MLLAVHRKRQKPFVSVTPYRADVKYSTRPYPVQSERRHGIGQTYFIHNPSGEDSKAFYPL